MNILFIYPEAGFRRPDCLTMSGGRYYHGLAMLSAVLKQHGHTTSLIHLTGPYDPAELIKKIEFHGPDLVAMSSITHNFPEIPPLARIAGIDMGLPVVCGGIHPTLAPLECLNVPGIRYICVGEGEETLLQLANNGDIRQIPGLWYKDESGKVVANKAGPCIDPDALPLPHWELFDLSTIDEIVMFKRLAVMGGRGCPYSCHYCCNHVIRRRMNAGRGYYRPRDPAKVVEEIREFISRYPGLIKEVQFQQDVFAPDYRWIEVFAEHYGRHVGLPFQALLRPGMINRKVARTLAHCGCNNVFFGLEAGDDSIRKDLLGRTGKADDVVRAARILKKERISIGTFNIAAIPGRISSHMSSAAWLNSAVSPDYIQLSNLSPYPGTDLYMDFRKRRLVNRAVYPTYFDGSPVRGNWRERERLNDAFFYAVEAFRRCRTFGRTTAAILGAIVSFVYVRMPEKFVEYCDYYGIIPESFRVRF